MSKAVKGILAPAGYNMCHYVTHGKIYEFHNGNYSEVWFLNDIGIKQELLSNPSSKFTEIPENGFVVQCTDHLSAYPWDKDEFLVVTKGSSAGNPGEYYDVHGHHSSKLSIVRQEDCKVVTGDCQVKLPKYIVVEEKITGLTVGMHYEVMSINISGSYLVSRGDGYSLSIVSPDKCHTWFNGEYKTVPCRDASFIAPTEKRVPAPLLPDCFDDRLALEIKGQKYRAWDLMQQIQRKHNWRMEIAGGAPRNWHFNRAANDIDYFVHHPMSYNGKWKLSNPTLRKMLEAMGVENVYDMATHNADGTRKNREKTQREYDERLTDITVVLEGTFQDQKVQFIFIEYGGTIADYVVDHFDTSINMITAVRKLGECGLTIIPSQRFTESNAAGVIFVYENQSAYSNNHLERIANYFPTAPLVRDSFDEIVLADPSRAYEYAQSWEDILDEQMKEQNERERDFDDFF